MTNWSHRILAAVFVATCSLSSTVMAAKGPDALKDVLINRCFAPGSAGEKVNVEGLRRLKGQEARNWRGASSGKVYSMDDYPAVPTILIVPTRASEPACHVIHKGMNASEFTTFMKDVEQSGFVELKEFASDEEGIKTMALGSADGELRVILGVNVSGLLGSTFFVHTQTSLEAQ